jgi:hypothetical protein
LDNPLSGGERGLRTLSHSGFDETQIINISQTNDNLSLFQTMQANTLGICNYTFSLHNKIYGPMCLKQNNPVVERQRVLLSIRL